ncbi:MAG: hypothetical protein HDQ88_09205 [Clostridia bacterium]|nr:hypothetical protein [Clostridia bacterium]
MKKNIKIISLILCLIAVLALFPACSSVASADNSSLKSITKPYIGEYECVEARLGDKNLLEKYEFIKITLVDNENMEVSYKPKNGKKKTYEGAYSVDPNTREFTGEIWVVGIKFREKTKIENGKFVLTKNLFTTPLIMKFEMK